MCYSRLTTSSRDTYDAIVLRCQEPRYAPGVPPLALVPVLYKTDILERMDAFIRDLQAHGRSTLGQDDLRVLLDIALMAEDDARAGMLKHHAHRLATTGDPVSLRDVTVFNDVMQMVYSQRVQKRAAMLREELRSCVNPGCARVTITRAPYRIERPAGEERPGENFEALYTLLQRPAWWAPLGMFEEESVVLAQRRYRLALRIGVAKHDDMSVLGTCTPLKDVGSQALRAALERTLVYSEWFQNIFNSFYEPELCPGDYRYAMRQEARKHAAEVVLVLTALRNTITQVINDIATPPGAAPLQLGQGCGEFPRQPVWVRRGRLPQGPILLPEEELAVRARALLQIGVGIRYAGRERFLRHHEPGQVSADSAPRRAASVSRLRGRRARPAAAAAREPGPRRRRRQPQRREAPGSDSPRSGTSRRNPARPATRRPRPQRAERRPRFRSR